MRTFQGSEEFEMQRRIVGELESNVNNRDWRVWVRFDIDGNSEVSLAGLADEVETWLASLDQDVEVESGYGVEWVGRGHVDLKAIPRWRESRGGPPLVGNPVPSGRVLDGKLDRGQSGGPCCAAREPVTRVVSDGVVRGEAEQLIFV
jgi:hypothetical protein